MEPLEGVALVTGSSSGIGEGIARRLAEEGMRVVIHSRSSAERGRALAREIGGLYVQADIADGDQSRRMVDEVIGTLGRLDLLVNNAGTTQEIPHADLDAADREVWRRIFEVNVFGTWDLCVAAMPHLRVAPHGHIVMITSLGGQRPLGSSIPYSVSKAAADQLTRILASTVGPEVRVNAVAPGFVDTPWTSEWHELRARVAAEVPLQRVATPDDIAIAVAGLHRTTYATGQVLAVDGGYHLR
ncbi:MAG: Granaticin polyketide synthase putative ketoacyl reductase 2 [Frondihabitans sp.]|jgi:ketoreductase RED2|nr:Granaticin polyketide synthase putative ketoacyl reductase 2 [Frondihabitans sp.]